MARPRNPQLLNLIKELVADEVLEEDTALLGIAMKVAFQGREELTSGQDAVFMRKLLPMLADVDPGIDASDL